MAGLCLLDQEIWFPSPQLALDEPNGLLAIGGDLSVERLRLAYANGIFPWYSDDQPILWWSPDPRCVLFPDRIHISRSLRKKLRRGDYEITIDQAFSQVIRECAAPRAKQDGTWITREIEAAYIRLHELGLAHSFECWQGGQLVGGLYGVAMGRCFFGESMFSRVTDASKITFVHLAGQLKAWNYAIIDCQVENPHLISLGAESISRDRFLSILHANRNAKPVPHQWHLDWHYTD